MTLRNTVLAMTAVFGLSVWAWSRPAEADARVAGVQTVAEGDAEGGTYHEAAARFRANQARHWRQQAIVR